MAAPTGDESRDLLNRAWASLRARCFWCRRDGTNFENEPRVMDSSWGRDWIHFPKVVGTSDNPPRCELDASDRDGLAAIAALRAQLTHPEPQATPPEPMRTRA